MSRTMVEDCLSIPVGETLPGMWNPQEANYAGKLHWEDYKETFSQLLKDPELNSDQWLIKPIWERLLLGRFGKIPDNPNNSGYLWRWNKFTENARNLVNGFIKNGTKYNPEVQKSSEQPSIHIDSIGKIYVAQGNKRTALCQLVHGPEYQIKYKVLSRHPDWVKKIENVYPLGEKKLYHPYPHPDFNNWPIAQPCQERFDMINKFIGNRTGTHRSILDIGCHTGWLCREFADFNWNFFGIDNEWCNIDLAKDRESQLDRQMGEYLLCSALDPEILIKISGGFDVCLLLSILMHLLKQNGQKTIQLLQTISSNCPILFIDCGFGGYQKYLPFSSGNIQEWVLSNTNYSQTKILGISERDKEPRRLYVFTK